MKAAKKLKKYTRSSFLCSYYPVL